MVSLRQLKHIISINDHETIDFYFLYIIISNFQQI